MNQVLSGIFLIVGSILTLYLVIIMIRVLASWFTTGVALPFMDLLARVTDPYLNFFRRFKFLQLKSLDLSPLFAFIVLLIPIQLCLTVAAYHNIWFGLVLAIFIQVIGGVIAFLFGFFAILGAIRLFGIFVKVSSLSQFWFALDHLLQPLIYPIITRLSPRRVMPYGNALAIFMVINFVFWFLCNTFIPKLADLAQMIQF